MREERRDKALRVTTIIKPAQGLYGRNGIVPVETFLREHDTTTLTTAQTTHDATLLYNVTEKLAESTLKFIYRLPTLLW